MSYVQGESDVNPTESETTSMVRNIPNGSREIPVSSSSSMEPDRPTHSKQSHGTTYESRTNRYHWIDAARLCIDSNNCRA